MAFLSVENACFSYNGRRVLDQVSVSVEKGQILSILGPNGSGKTTLLKLILGFHKPDSGAIFIGDRPVSHLSPRFLAREIAYVPQVHRMAFSYRMLDVVMMGRIPHKPFFFRYSKADERLAASSMERLGIGHLADRPYTAVSGGERQLCLIARAMTQEAHTFVMDEPVSGLDYGHQIRLLSMIRELAHEGYTFIQTTHFPDHAIWMGGRVLMLDKGRVTAEGPAEEAVTPQALTALYHLDMDVVRTVCGSTVCLPDAVRVMTRERSGMD